MPASENCVFCHGRADLIKRGFSWNDRENHDVHNMHGVDCVCCHQGGPDHNLAKGNENLSTVRDDLDDTMIKCRECHEKGYIGAPLPVHKKIRPNHLEKISCEACHIPRLERAAAQGLCVSSGKVINYPKGSAGILGEAQAWKPDYHKGAEGRLKPVNRFIANLYTNLEADGIHYPLFAGEMAAAYDQIRHLVDGADEAPLVRTRTQIQAMLTALERTLSENPRFQQIRPAYHYQGQRYFINAKGRLAWELDRTWVAEEKGFNISHNVAPTRLALGAGGCDDCHAQSAHMFESWIAGSAGATGGGGPHAQSAGLQVNSLEVYLKELHEHNHLKWTLGPAAFVLIFVLAVLLSGDRTHFSRSLAGTYAALSLLTIPLRRGALGVLVFTGYLFFYNNIPLLEMIFQDMSAAIRIHMAAGIVLILCSVPMLFPKRGRRLESTFLMLLIFSGALICFKENFGFFMKYGIAVVHAACALVYISLRVAHRYRRAIMHAPSHEEASTHCRP